ncbi:hypothetical protein ACFSYG_16210 [Leeuwenhoekiella polynyae]|mgnify:CR=1 FL=1|uniref:Uncharacterized protein n=1 Tax=Leeuwenhoekiella polynyae TaxID=1550906 RepID=A0A4Q0PGZ5_9FLAO|nr:hypothetical protein [Leeuwenhoekiella polynyae]RXG25836.1 hypothetical protein DSM02_1006 [Leeuwenhoekiella polynyae]
MMNNNQYFKIVALLVCTFSVTGMFAQYDAISNIPLKQDHRYQWSDESKRASLKESKMQVEYFLEQKNSDQYIYIVDGQVLDTKVLQEFKASILKQAKAIHFVRSVDSIMGYPSKRKRMLVLINTDIVSDK